MKKLIFVYTFILLLLSFFSVEIINQVTNEKIITIYIDPGHGGSDGGAIGYDGTYEKDIDLAISLELCATFKNYGYRVYMTRDGDYDIAPEDSHNRKRDDIHKRVKLINESDADLFISIHANSFPSHKVWGTQTFYKKNDSMSRELAVCVQDSILINLLNTERIAKSISGIYLIDHATKPGCLVEVGFLSNPNDLANLKTESYQDKLANAIFIGVCDYLEKNT